LKVTLATVAFGNHKFGIWIKTSPLRRYLNFRPTISCRAQIDCTGIQLTN
jgi:hypothetical protein